MSFLRFQHVFAILMLLSILSAFVLPARFNHRVSDPARANLQGLFAPIAHPARAAAAFLHGKFVAKETRDTRAASTLADENLRLRSEVANLMGQLQALQKLNADRDRVGPIRQFCTPVTVIASDPGTRDSLSLGGATLSEITEGQAVLYDVAVIGRVERRGVAGAQVRLITDVGSRFTGVFGKFESLPGGAMNFQPVRCQVPLVEGAGRGMMVVRNLPLADVQTAGLQVGDWVVLKDADWPAILKDKAVGTVVSIGPQTRHPLHAEIQIRPFADLLKLREAMVLTKE